MWRVFKNTEKRLPTWIGGKFLSPYVSTANLCLDNHSPELIYLTTVNFIQKHKLPFLIGFSIVDTGENGYNNSNSRNPTPDLNSCYYLTVGEFVTSKTATIDFYFADLNSYKDLDWVNYYSAEAIVFKDKDAAQYKVSDLKGIPITDRTIIKIRLKFDIFLPFLGFTSFVRNRKLLKLTSININTDVIKYYGQIYKFDKYLDFSKRTFFKFNGDIYLCP